MGICVISIHSPRMGRDLTVSTAPPQSSPFQSTLPAWGETTVWMDSPTAEEISIHSPRMGRDGSRPGRSSGRPYFNPLSPHGERRMCGAAATARTAFQSTLPAWGETANAHNFSKRKTGASAQHCIFSPATRFFLLTKNFLEKRNKPFFRCEPYRKNVEAPVSHQPLKN